MGRTLFLRCSNETGKANVMPDTPPASSGLPFPTSPNVTFANWREAPHTSGLSPGLQTVYRVRERASGEVVSGKPGPSRTGLRRRRSGEGGVQPFNSQPSTLNSQLFFIPGVQPFNSQLSTLNSQLPHHSTPAPSPLGRLATRYRSASAASSPPRPSSST